MTPFGGSECGRTTSFSLFPSHDAHRLECATADSFLGYAGAVNKTVRPCFSRIQRLGVSTAVDEIRRASSTCCELSAGNGAGSLLGAYINKMALDEVCFAKQDPLRLFPAQSAGRFRKASATPAHQMSRSRSQAAVRSTNRNAVKASSSRPGASLEDERRRPEKSRRYLIGINPKCSWQTITRRRGLRGTPMSYYRRAYPLNSEAAKENATRRCASKR